MNNTDKLNKIEEFFSRLEGIEWFANVGEPYDRSGIRCVDSWEDAYKWTNQPITEWCSFEAKNRIYAFMSENHYDVFAKWNDVAKSLLPTSLQLVDVVKKRFPHDAPEQAIERLQSQIVGASLEVYYCEYVESTLLRDQIDIYKDGHFPCGWYVESEEGFPSRAEVVVF